jgi:hypothetical protein
MILKTFYTILAALSLTMTLTHTAIALDDFDLAKYGPEDTIEIGRTEFIIKLKLYESDETLNEEYEKLAGTDIPEGSGVRGFAIVSEFEDVCYIHIVRPKIWDDREAMAIFGHETYHCALANHARIMDERIEDAKKKEESETESQIADTVIDVSEQDLLDLDRKLEMENLQYECTHPDPLFENLPAGCSDIDMANPANN